MDASLVLRCPIPLVPFLKWGKGIKEDEKFVEGVLKLNAIFKRLAQERHIDIDELQKQEA
jgi:hypothetical protein